MALLEKDNEKKQKNLLEVDSLSVNYVSGRRLTRAVKGISFNVEEQSTTSLVGESGSGKSTTAAAIIGLLPHASGHAKIKGYTIPSHPKYIKAGFNRFLAEQMQFVFQDPFTSLNPRTRVGNVLYEPLRVNNPIKKEKKDGLIDFTRAINNLIVDTINVSDLRKKELKEMTNRITNERVELVHKAKDDIDLAVYHIKNVKSQIWQAKKTELTKISAFKELRVAEQRDLLKSGVSNNEIKEKIRKDNLDLANYSREIREERKEKVNELRENISSFKEEIRDAKKARKDTIKRLDKDRRTFDELVLRYSPILKGSSKWPIRRLDHKSPEYLSHIGKGKKFGRSRSTASHIKEIRQGSLLDWRDFRKITSSINQVVFSSRVATAKAEELLKTYLHNYSRVAIRRRTVKLIQDKLVEVGLRAADINRYSREFSGGQRQRIAIARAMMTNPSFMIADEPISSLDVSIQAQVVNIFKDIQVKHGLTMLFIAHDLRMVEHISDYIAVMSKGQIVEYGKTEEIFTNPTHPYTRSLLSSIPSIDTINLKLNVVEYNPRVYQNEDLELKEIYLSPTHKVLAREEWIKKWKKEADAFVVYENQARHAGAF